MWRQDHNGFSHQDPGFLDHVVKGRESGVFDSPVTAYVMGDGWRDFDAWPPSSARPVDYYLHSGGRANSVYGDGTAITHGPQIDICQEVRTGDTVLLPSGYHGPSMAAPGYDLYYLNVMAGPGERAWRFTDDPAHAWIRDSWAGQEIDPRLPMSTARGHA